MSIAKKLEINAKVENLSSVLMFLNEILDDTSCNFKERFALEEAVEEIFVNIAKYAYLQGDGKVYIEVNCDDDVVEITFIDEGVEYNPLLKDDPNFDIPLEDRPIGGLGIYMVKNLMDEVIYNYLDNKNVLRIKKFLKESD